MHTQPEFSTLGWANLKTVSHIHGHWYYYLLSTFQSQCPEGFGTHDHYSSMRKYSDVPLHLGYIILKQANTHNYYFRIINRVSVLNYHDRIKNLPDATGMTVGP